MNQRLVTFRGEMVLKRRLTEAGKHVVILLDSLPVWRAYNTVVPSGKFFRVEWIPMLFIGRNVSSVPLEILNMVVP